MSRPAWTPLISAGLLLGAGLGGFVDGIVFHQILQWHHMLSTLVPVVSVVNIKVNMFWDGVFHAGVWVLTVTGLAFLWRAGGRKNVPWSGTVFLGALAAGWGCFNLVEGGIDHEILGIHHVNEYAADKTGADLAFLLFGLGMLFIGAWAMRIGIRRPWVGREEVRHL